MHATPTLSLYERPFQNIWLSLPKIFISLMMWHSDDGTDTCKSEAMWRFFTSRKYTDNRTRGFAVFFPPSPPQKFPITMAEDPCLRRELHSPPVPSDPESLPELTRSGSDFSAITVDNASKDSSRHSTVSSFPDQSARWTNQQHSLYLSSLEASFVNELHHSIRLRGWSFHNNTDGAYKCRTLKSSHNMRKQSLALQDGCQKKINLERVAPMLESTADSHVHAGSQLGLTSIDRACSLREPNICDHDLLCDEEIHAKGCSAFNKSPSSSVEKQCIFRSFHAESSCSSEEITDQNFKDEVDSSSTMPMAKRLKTAAADGSSSDQVVPYEKFHTSDISNATSENKGHELLSELPQS